MKKKDYLGCFILLAGSVAGYFIDGWIGGIITGSTTAMLILVLLGKPVYLRAVREQELRAVQREIDYFENLKADTDEYRD